MKHKFTQTLAFLLFLAATVSAQPCQYLAYDGFDYAAGLPLHGLSGGSGWANPWEVQVADQSIPGYQTQSGGSLFWPGLQAPGTSLGGGKAYLTAGRLLNTDSDGVFADFVGDNGEFVGDKKGTVLWMSALVRKEKNNNSAVFTGLHDSNIPWCDNCTSGKVEIGYFGANSEVNGEKRWTLRLGDQYFMSQVPISIGQAAFLVMRDGSPTVSGATINHTYHTTGELTVKMTVRDSGGLESVAVKRITVRKSDGSFPCQTSFSLLRQASCDGTGGILRINNPASSFSLQNSSGQLISPDQNIYNNLSAGNYLYTAQGNNGCRDAFPLVIPVDSTTCNGWEQDICHMLIGTNLSGLADWSPERPLRNLMKHVRPEPVVYDDACWCWDNGNLAGIQTDTNGYPLQIPQLYNGVENKVRYVISAGGGNLQAGKTYVLLFDGSGSLNVAGSVNTISSTPGRILFSVQSDG
ncbi:MAG: PKD domain-containing protein, partial [Saprospiraceae bacterium]|nr:PKD domain-containing protein [Saprospiraceae bacterium]